MLTAALISLVSIALGVFIAVGARRAQGLLGPVHSFALAAALGVVLVHLIPEAVDSLGPWAIAIAGLGTMVPVLLERVVTPRGGAPRRAARLEASFLALAVHEVGDGFALSSFAGHGGHVHWDVLGAVAAHTVPVVAGMVLIYDSLLGRRAALVRAGWLLGARLLGVGLGSFVAVGHESAASGWIAALVAGTLVHVVVHDLTAHPPTTPRARFLDLAGASLGVALAWLGNSAYHGTHGHDSARDRLGASLLDLSLETAPMLLLGLAAGAALQGLGSHFPDRWLARRSLLGDSVRGAVVGAPLPLCSCGVLPVTRALERRGASAALVVAFLIATPELGLETLTITVQLMGWPYALARVGGALLVAIAAGLAVGIVVARSEPTEPPSGGVLGAAEGDGFVARTVAAFDELLHHVGAWTVLGVVVAALVATLVPDGGMGLGVTGVGELLLVTALAVPSYVCASSATPLAAVLVGKGLSSGAALVGLLLGPATNVATLAFLRRAFGVRGLVACLVAVVAVSWTLALVVTRWVPVASAPGAGAAHEHGPAAWAALIVTGALLLRAAWRSGFRAWMTAVFGGAEGDGHSHEAHGHGGHGGHGPDADDGHGHGGHGHGGHGHGGHGHGGHGH